MSSSLNIGSHCNARTKDLEFMREFTNIDEKIGAVNNTNKGRQNKTSSHKRYHLCRKRLLKSVRSPNQAANTTSNLIKPKVLYRPSRRRVWKKNLKIGNHSKYIETHVWHSKRMKMTNIYGCNIPARHNNYGCTYLRRHILHKQSIGAAIQDISFFKVLEIIGSHASLTQLLSSFLDCEQLSSALPIDISVLSNVKERVVMFHRENAFPNGSIGPVTLSVKKRESSIQVWVWCHPCIVEDVYSELTNCAHNYINNESETSLTIKNLRCDNQPNRFSLRGNNCHKFLIRAMLSLNKAYKDSARGIDEHDERRHASLELFLKVIQSHNSMNKWQDGDILNICLPDIRLTQVSARMMALSSICQTNANYQEPDINPSQSKFIWPHPQLVEPIIMDSSLRMQVSQSTVSDHEFLQTIHKRYLRLYQLQTTDQNNDQRRISNEDYSRILASNIPVQIIRKLSSTVTSTRNSAFSKRRYNRHFPLYDLSGYDIVVPKGLANVFLRYFVKLGALVMGYEDVEYLQRESDILSFPRDFLDTNAGISYWKRRSEEIQSIENKRPPNKRRTNNFEFLVNYQSIMKQRYSKHFPNESSVEGDAAQTVVIRPHNYASNFQISSILENILESTDEDNIFDPNCIPELPIMSFPSMLNVRVIPTSRGVPQDGAILYIPSHICYEIWMEHHCNRKSEIIVGNKRKRLSNWRGLEISENLTVSALSELSVGIITSGRNPNILRNNGNGLIGIGVCDAMMLYNSQRKAALSYLESKQSENKTLDNIKNLLKSSVYALVLFHNPRSKYMRPAIIEIITQEL